MRDTTLTPIHGNCELGHTEPHYTTGTDYVLEDGRRLNDRDFVQAQPATLYYNNNAGYTNLIIPTAFGFSIPNDTDKFGHCWGINAHGDLLKYTASNASLFGTTYGAMVNALQPSWLDTNTGYTVIMDRNIARVYLNYHINTCPCYLPLLMVDRFGHYVKFQWTQSTVADPNIVRMYRVDVRNQRNQGVTIRWVDAVNTSQEMDLGRVDFVNVSAPSGLCTKVSVS